MEIQRGVVSSPTALPQGLPTSSSPARAQPAAAAVKQQHSGKRSSFGR